MSTDAPTPPNPTSGPQIGADEWVRRSGERTTGPAGVVGFLNRVADRTPHILLLLAFVGFVSAIPFLTSNAYVIGVATDTMLYVLLAVGLNVAVGWAGMLDLGYVVFYGFAAYFFAELSSAHYGIHWSTWQSVPVVIVATILLGFLLSLPSLRLSGDYFAIVMLFFLEIFNNFTANGYTWDWFGLGSPHDITGGPTGITNIDPWRVFGHVLDPNNPQDYLWVATAGFFVIAILLTYVNQSRTGRAWRALREDSLAANLMGMPVKWLGLLAIAVGAGVAGFAGTINASYYQGVFPDAFTLQLLIMLYAMVILGGAGNLGGVVFGAVAVNVMLEILTTPDHARWVFYAAVLLGLLASLRPWKVLAAVLAGLVAFGLVAHAIVGAISARAVGGPIAVGPTSFTTHGFFATLIRHWMVLPKGTYENADYRPGNYAFVIVIAMVLTCTVVKGWKRYVLLVPTIWGAAFVWETDLVNQGPTTRYLLLGALLITLMASRPNGIFGQQRVEIV
jgi:ABC-type branched-subunit amino acid transport system permease subunit